MPPKYKAGDVPAKLEVGMVLFGDTSEPAEKSVVGRVQEIQCLTPDGELYAVGNLAGVFGYPKFRWYADNRLGRKLAENFTPPEPPRDRVVKVYHIGMRRWLYVWDETLVTSERRREHHLLTKSKADALRDWIRNNGKIAATFRLVKGGR